MADNPDHFQPIQDGAVFDPVRFRDVDMEEVREFGEEQIRAERRRAARLRRQHLMRRRARDHQLRAAELRHRVYKVEKIFADRLEKFECALCKTCIVNTEFEEHVEACAKEKGVPENQPYILEQEIYKIREYLEIEYLEVTADREKIMDMHCILCHTSHEHKAGLCYPDRQKHAFKQKVNDPAQLYVAHYQNWLIYTKQKGLDEINERHAAHFAYIERLAVASEQIGSVTENERQNVWSDYRQKTMRQNEAERAKFVERENKKIRSLVRKKANAIMAIVNDELEAMQQYLNVNMVSPDIEKSHPIPKNSSGRGSRSGQQFRSSRFSEYATTRSSGCGTC
ncbi:hypothetical protein B9Z55_007974 [Caenorhabditis nigoni]|uniref:Uncharacterized protein n=1 Tax=Caenorhabditis nigoni TaxID=1611254 RepID=A0A2G5VC50_9PELO|nr:hypothetical protein B9Z55_007974 [Caenorhabditis nigoni]